MPAVSEGECRAWEESEELWRGYGEAASKIKQKGKL